MSVLNSGPKTCFSCSAPRRAVRPSKPLTPRSDKNVPPAPISWHRDEMGFSAQRLRAFSTRPNVLISVPRVKPRLTLMYQNLERMFDGIVPSLTKKVKVHHG